MEKNVKLSHIGVKRYLFLVSSNTLDDNQKFNILNAIYKNIHLPYKKDFDTLLDDGYLQFTNDDFAQTKRFYDYPFLENVKKVHFEITTECNFHCDHCRSGDVYRISEENIKNLYSVVDLFSNLGIKRYDFIGGEVTLYGGKWLDLVKYINNKSKNSMITVYTNGWFLEKTNFTIEDKIYKDDEEYLNHLKNNGLTHILFSIDGKEEFHDNNRHHKGLYQRIYDSIGKVKSIGLLPRLSVVVRHGEDLSYLAPFAQKIYDLNYLSDSEALLKMRSDSSNHFSNFIDVNNGAQLRKGTFNINQSYLFEDKLHCKAFYRPAPTFRIRANGSIGMCPLMNEDELYGSLKNTSIINIVNNAHTTFSYQLHSQKFIKKYLPLLDKNVLSTFDHLCTLRVALHELALKQALCFLK